MGSSTELLPSFGEIARRGHALKLYNAYRGVPIVYEAHIINVDSSCVNIEVHEFQAVCLALEGMTYIESALLPGIIRARCILVNIKDREARLVEFAAGELSAGKRVTVRVQPKEPTDVRLFDANNNQINGILADVSAEGIGVITFTTNTFAGLPFKKGNEIIADINLPGITKVTHFMGKIASVYSKGKFTNRLGLQLQPDPSVVPMLQEYIALRQQEILVELKGVYETMCQENKKTKAMGLGAA